jgi:nucleotide-binding universal stress UspA family protein
MGADWVDQHVDGMMASRRNQSEQLIQSAHCGHLDVIKMFETGVPSEEILKAIEETGADLLVIGTKGRTRLADALFGSVAERLYRRSPVSVLSVRGQEHADLVCKLAD